MEYQAAIHITQEVLCYLLYHQLPVFDLKFDLNTSRFQLTIDVETDRLPEDFEEFMEELNAERDCDVDEYFGNLLGNPHSHQHYLILGESIDEAQSHFENGHLRLILTRFHIK